MAKATKKTANYTVELELTKPEAQTLLRVILSVGGEPDGKRFHMTELAQVLQGSGVTPMSATGVVGTIELP